MLLKFPGNIDGHQALKVGNQHFALLKQRTKAHKRTLFLEENVLIFVIEGHKLLHFENTTVKISEGSVLVLKRGFYVMSDFVEDGLNFQSLLIYFSNEHLKKFLLKFNYAKAVPHNNEEFLNIPLTPALENFREHYLHYFSQHFDALGTVLNLKLYELYLLLLSSPQQQQVLSFFQQIAFQQPTDLGYIIKQHLFQPLSLPELAKLSGRSLASFKRDFTQQFHKAPGRWISEQRLEHARILLQQTNKQVAEIAYECGYNNVPHFIKSYKQLFGLTPNQDRSNKVMI
ncbi:AraC-type transcriptional regulator N-terminus [Chitinophaga terrae (ex Kim and Jung 2007)]|jgi:AraC-like DNA-binding protein|uniref:AraC-type transcriptional regulator N-terminus n=1 Tax=Chitinophaga terrae (ex Kim and Jung 2007) TaxID=408074 RepID=A0A1H4DFM8_9BACT|nr:helix-turn-helix domain-containing protein [Chitinophaga terrae (ex Kim and Jung 2007)]MDQ0107702.1 AraC-like DNA-binding protein [Chitinophaga terrae (ex Kim and Jung 2007)]GEP92682.1 hypothetical protein CTE07_43270 [Chitinophaga terrae (ex Kim and Jung 2007)]SEA71397.1 AraC-type transcriptional regulator N-terminus [Chitinophaga terrae (ex Kim and Jung 2007)]